MSTNREYVEFICDQAKSARNIRFQAMFGEFAIYCDEKVVALVCDNQLFLKPNPETRALLATVTEAPPYPGAKPSFLISDLVDDRALLAKLFRLTADALPAPRPKKVAKTLAKSAAKTATKTVARTAGTKPKPVLLSGGNPQITKADGNAPVSAYISAMPGWKRDIGRQLDALIMKTVPGVSKAVKWNSPFYGVEGEGWFMSFHTFTNFVKVTFFMGTSLTPAPSGGKAKEARWIDVHQDDLNEKQMTKWIKQAAAIPGWLKA